MGNTPSQRTHVTKSILPFDSAPRKMSPEIPFRYFPFTVARVSALSLDALHTHPAWEQCGLVIEHADGSVDCWVLVAPFRYNKHSILTRMLESLCYILKLPHRVLIYIAMKMSIAEAPVPPTTKVFDEILACQ